MTGENNWMEKIIRDYGSLEAYNEEQRRCGLSQIEVQAQTGHKNVRVDCANVVESTTPENETVLPKSQAKPHFNLRLFRAKA